MALQEDLAPSIQSGTERWQLNREVALLEDLALGVQQWFDIKTHVETTNLDFFIYVFSPINMGPLSS